MKKIVILGGGTHTYINNHLALSAPSYGYTAEQLESKFRLHSENDMLVELHLTKMADKGNKQRSIQRSLEYNRQIVKDQTFKKVLEARVKSLEEELIRYPLLDTPEDVEKLVDHLITDPDIRVIIFNITMVDYKPESLTEEVYDNPEYTYHKDVVTSFGKYAGKLSTRDHPELRLELSARDKIIQKIRKERKDILLVGFKTTCGATKEEQYEKGLRLCKEASANIVFVNDVDENRVKALDILAQQVHEHYNKPEQNRAFVHTNGRTIEYALGADITNLNYIRSHLGELAPELQSNGLVTYDESSYWYNTRDEALDALVQMVLDYPYICKTDKVPLEDC